MDYSFLVKSTCYTTKIKYLERKSRGFYYFTNDKNLDIFLNILAFILILKIIKKIDALQYERWSDEVGHKFYYLFERL